MSSCRPQTSRRDPIPDLQWALTRIYGLDLQELLQITWHVEAAASVMLRPVVGKRPRARNTQQLPRLTLSESNSSLRCGTSSTTMSPKSPPPVEMTGNSRGETRLHNHKSKMILHR